MSTATTATSSTGLATGVGLIHLKVADADRAMTFFAGLLDWEGEPYRDAGSTRYYVTNTPLLTVLTDEADVPPVCLWFAVDDVAAAVHRIAELAGTAVDVNVDEEWARVQDPQGLSFGIWSRRSEHRGSTPSRAARGGIGYMTVQYPDGPRGVEFWQQFLGWEFDEPRPNGYRHVVNAGPAIGIYGEGDAPEVAWYVRVTGVDELAARVTALGGTVQSVSDSPAGRTATCFDDQGMRFYLWEASPGY